MKFASLYRASLYATLVLASLALSADASSESRLAMLYPVAVFLTGIMAYFTVDRRPHAGLSRDLAIFLAIGSFGLAILEYSVEQSPARLLLALGHLLVYLQLVKMMMPKSVEDDWFLFGLGLVQVVIGVFLSQADLVGFLLLAWAMASLWTFSLFHLHREVGRIKTPEGVSILPAPRRDEPYPGLVNPAFVLSGVGIAAATLVLGGLIFLIMPRWTAAGGMRRGPAASKHLTGFSDQVQLGQMGEILESDSIVMTIELFDDQTDQRIEPDAELLWRGIAMSRYAQQKWHRQRVDAIDAGPVNPAARVIRQQIALEPTDSDVLFGLRPVLDVRSRSGEPTLNRVDGSIFRRDARPEMSFGRRPPNRSSTYLYQVRSVSDGMPYQPGEDYPDPDTNDGRDLLEIPHELQDRLQEIAAPIIARIPKTDPRARALALQAYLRDRGGYSYTLQMSVVDPSIDPVLDFLLNRKSGHCEYFASALALLLRSVGIPARIVNGFKGGDWNGLVRALYVRGKHAHSWVEALVGQEPDNGAPVWLTLDPTPAMQREQVVASVSRVPRPVRTLTDSIRQFWVVFVAGYDKDRQEQWIYGPARQVVRDAGRGFRLMWETATALFRGLFRFQRPRDFFSVNGFLVSTALMLFFAGVFLALRRLYRAFLKITPRNATDPLASTPGTALYQRLTRLLAGRVAERRFNETPREFARRATSSVIARSASLRPVADVPALVVDAFYASRFGDLTLPPAELAHVEGRLDEFEKCLSAESAGSAVGR